MSLPFRSVRALVACAFLSLNGVACGASPDDPEVEKTVASDVTSAGAHFETFVGDDHKHYFELVAANGENLLRSRGHADAGSAGDAAEALVTRAREPGAFRIDQAPNGDHHFDLVGDDGETVASSDAYASAEGAVRGARVVRSVLLLAPSGRLETRPAARVERFEVYTAEDQETYFRLRAANGEVVLGSQGYTTSSAAHAGLALVQERARDAAAYQVECTRDARFALTLAGHNGRTIARAGTFASQAEAQRAAERIATIVAGPVAFEDVR